MPPVLRKIGIGTGNPSLSNANATDSICPYGWQLAENETESEKSFSNLTNTYIFRATNTVSSLRNADIGLLILSFIRSGSYVDGAFTNQTTSGYYWSLRGGSDANAYRLGFSSNGVYPQYSSPYGYGRSLRCFAR